MMRILALGAIFGISAHATQWNAVVEDSSILRRSSFQAQQTTKAGHNCTEAFGDGYEICRPATKTEIRLCYNPSIGQVCCENEWGCPSGSYCLVDNYCCPTGIDAQTCAHTYGVSLPPNFKPGGSGPPTTSYLYQTVYVIPTTTVSWLPPNPKPTVSVVPYPAGNVSHGCNHSTTGATGTMFPYPTGSYVASAALFTGAAERVVSAVNSQSLLGMGAACILAMLGVF